MLSLESNGIRPRRKATEAWITQHSHQQQQQNVYSVLEHPNFIPVYNKNHKIFENDTMRKQIKNHERDHQNHQATPSSSIATDIKDYAHGYFDKCSLHGLRYVADTSISLTERVFWFFAFMTAFSFAAYFISVLYFKWNDNPVIVSFNPMDANIKDIPFPAITICSMNQAGKPEAEDIVKNGPDLDRHLLDDYCSLNNTFGNDTIDGESTEWEHVFNFLLKVGQSCNDILRVCQWQLKKMDCNAYFNSELTDEGLCCSFNMLPPKKIFRNWRSMAMLNKTFPVSVHDWTPEKGFLGNVSADAIPLRPLGAGAHLGLTVVLDAQTDNYYCSSTSSIGFKILLSNPIETPKMADFSFFLCPGIESRIVIEPDVSEATLTLRSVDIEKRKCYFADERRLQFYRTYTERNCKLECQANYTLDSCGCVPYFLPKSTSTRICDRSQEICSNAAKEAMEKIINNKSNCNCLPGCFELNFKKTSSFSRLTKKLKIKENLRGNISEDYFVENMAIAHFYFTNTNFRKTIKREIYTFSEFLSNTGGLLGLFLGFSCLSAVEIIYYLTLRLFCASLSSRKKKNIHIPFTQ